MLRKALGWKVTGKPLFRHERLQNGSLDIGVFNFRDIQKLERRLKAVTQKVFGLSYSRRSTFNSRDRI